MSHLRHCRGELSDVDYRLVTNGCWTPGGTFGSFLFVVPYRFKPHRESIEEGYRRIAVEQLERAIEACADSQRSVHERVHEVRRRCKKARALHRLLRSSLGEASYQQENAALRDVARSVAHSRDVYVMRRSYDALVGACELEVNRHKLAPIARELTEEIDTLVEQDLAMRLEGLVDPLRAAIERVQGLSLEQSGFEAIAGGLKKSYKRAHKAMKKAYAKPSPARFHEFRKRSKYHRYHVKLLKSLWPSQMRTREAALHRLTDLLGEDHDLSVLHAWLKRENPASKDARALLRGLVLERRERCEKQARPLAQRLFCDSPKAHQKHMRALSRASW